MKTIIYFDGVCNLCNNFVDFLLPKILEGVRFASLQGKTAQENLPSHLTEQMGSVVVTLDHSVYTHASAIKIIFKKTKKPWSYLGAILSIFPDSFINLFYRLIAKHRYRLFGKKDTCRLPSESEKNYFLP